MNLVRLTAEKAQAMNILQQLSEKARAGAVLGCFRGDEAASIGDASVLGSIFFRWDVSLLSAQVRILDMIYWLQFARRDDVMKWVLPRAIASECGLGRL